jgi:hypothetical protein
MVKQFENIDKEEYFFKELEVFAEKRGFVCACGC